MYRAWTSWIKDMGSSVGIVAYPESGGGASPAHRQNSYKPDMRVRKLAKELALTEPEVFGILHTMGHARYVSPEQMLPTELVEQLRKRAPPPPAKAAGWRPPEEREIRNLDAPATKAAPRPSTKAASAPPKSTGAPKPTATKAPGPTAAPVPAPEPLPHPVLFGEQEEEIQRLRDRMSALERELASSENHRRALLRALSTVSGRETHQSVRDAFIRRGLIGDDEIALALRAWGEHHRLQELLDPLQVGNPVAFQSLLDERMLLVGPGEECPAGLVPVTVAPDRSERHTASPVRSALARVATAMLISGKRRLVVHGGAAAWQREFKEGLDPRIDLRFYPHLGRGPLPDSGVADIVVLWDSAVTDPRLTERHPKAILILQRGLIPFCQALVDQLERF